MRDESASPVRPSPRVSVCIPVYNGSDFIAAAVRSVLAQTFADFEIVVQDNCSTDTTLAVLESFHDPRISVQRNERNLGLVANVNRAMARSRGEYVRLLCHDDVLAATCLEEQVRYLDTHPSVALVFTWCEVIDAEGASFGPMHLDRLVPEPEILAPTAAAMLLFGKGCSIHLSTVMGRRAHLTPFDGSFQGCVDWAKWAEVSAGADIAIIRKILGAVRLHDASLTHSVKRFRTEEVYRVLDALEPRLPDGFPVAQVRRQLYAQVEFAYAIWAALHGEVGHARDVLNVIRRHDPLPLVALAFVAERVARIRRLAARRWAPSEKASAKARSEPT